MEREATMYVCVCNAIREKDIRRAVLEDGARTPLDVFRACGAQPQCRMCVPDIRRLVQDVLAETVALDQICALARPDAPALPVGEVASKAS